MELTDDTMEGICMIIYKDECCDCAVPGYPCLGDACSNRHVPHIYCDKCGEEIYYDEHGFDTSEEVHFCANCDEDYIDENKEDCYD